MPSVRCAAVFEESLCHLKELQLPQTESAYATHWGNRWIYVGSSPGVTWCFSLSIQLQFPAIVVDRSDGLVQSLVSISAALEDAPRNLQVGRLKQHLNAADLQAWESGMWCVSIVLNDRSICNTRSDHSVFYPQWCSCKVFSFWMTAMIGRNSTATLFKYYSQPQMILRIIILCYNSLKKL